MTFSLCVAQPGSAPTLGVGGRWFESSRIDQQEDEPGRAGHRLESGWSRKAWASIAPVFRHLTRRSSVAEQRTHNPFVAGSIPAAATLTSLTVAQTVFAGASRPGIFYSALSGVGVPDSMNKSRPSEAISARRLG